MKYPICPICGEKMSYNEVIRGCKTYEINKNGKISKRSKAIINSEDIEISYLRCENFKCSFYYNLTFKTEYKEIYEELDGWYDKQF